MPEPNYDFQANEKQGLMMMLASGFEVPDGMGFLNLYNATMMLKAKIGEEPLKMIWGDNFNDNLSKLKALGQHSALISGYLHPYMDSDNFKKLLSEDDVTSERSIKFRKNLFAASQYLDLLFEAMVALIDASSIKALDIPNDYWRLNKEKMKY